LRSAVTVGRGIMKNAMKSTMKSMIGVDSLA